MLWEQCMPCREGGWRLVGEWLGQTIEFTWAFATKSLVLVFDNVGSCLFKRRAPE